MYIFNPDFTQRQAKQKEISRLPQVQEGAGFQGVLSSLLQQKAVEEMSSAEEKNIKKKKKDTKERIEDYREEIEAQHAVLAIEKKIRTVFRKIRLEI